MSGIALKALLGGASSGERAGSPFELMTSTKAGFTFSSFQRFNELELMA